MHELLLSPHLPIFPRNVPLERRLEHILHLLEKIGEEACSWFSFGCHHLLSDAVTAESRGETLQSANTWMRIFSRSLAMVLHRHLNSLHRVTRTG